LFWVDLSWICDEFSDGFELVCFGLIFIFFSRLKRIKGREKVKEEREFDEGET